MIELNGFRSWLANSSQYSKATISNTLSRLKRANKILPWYFDDIYLFHLERTYAYQQLSTSVRSQIKRAVKLYFEFFKFLETRDLTCSENSSSHKILSLFANIGVAEAYLEELGFRVVVANELIERRANLYSEIYPFTNMICGDITDSDTYNKILESSITAGVDIIMATPPCQGMSTAGQQDSDDYRNTLILPVIQAIKDIMPKYVFLENVPTFLNTSIVVNSERVLIPDLLNNELSEKYLIKKYIINTKDYSVPQMRERAIILMTKKGEDEWILPTKDSKIVTMSDAIGHLPILDPYVIDVHEEKLLELFPDFYSRKMQAESISKWHKPPHHIFRQVQAMMYTPTGCTAFDNDYYFPRKEDGTPVKGYHNTYKRQNWDTAAYTVTMDNRKISSQNNVHPGRYIGLGEDGLDIYSDARTLTLYEIMIIMSLPENWPVPIRTSEAFLRRVIGEGIPPLFVKKLFMSLKGDK